MALTLFVFLQALSVRSDHSFRVHRLTRPQILSSAYDRTEHDTSFKTCVNAYPDLLLRLLLTHAHELEERGQLLRHTDACRACTEEQDPVVLEWETGGFGGESSGVEETAEDDGTGALDLNEESKSANVWRATTC